MVVDWWNQFVCCYTRWRVPQEQGDSFLARCVWPSACQCPSAFFYKFGDLARIESIYFTSCSLTTLLPMVSRLVPHGCYAQFIDYLSFQTIIPDYLYGDAIPADALSSGNFDFVKWLVPNHTQDKTQPAIDKVVEALKSEGVTELAATGYCFGGTLLVPLFTDQEESQMVYYDKVATYLTSRSTISSK